MTTTVPHLIRRFVFFSAPQRGASSNPQRDS